MNCGYTFLMAIKINNTFLVNGSFFNSSLQFTNNYNSTTVHNIYYSYVICTIFFSQIFSIQFVWIYVYVMTLCICVTIFQIFTNILQTRIFHSKLLIHKIFVRSRLFVKTTEKSSVTTHPKINHSRRC